MLQGSVNRPACRRKGKSHPMRSTPRCVRSTGMATPLSERTSTPLRRFLDPDSPAHLLAFLFPLSLGTTFVGHLGFCHSRDGENSRQPVARKIHLETSGSNQAGAG